MFNKVKKNLLPKDLLVDLQKAEDVNLKVSQQAQKARGPNQWPTNSEIGTWQYASSSVSAIYSAIYSDMSSMVYSR